MHRQRALPGRGGDDPYGGAGGDVWVGLPDARALPARVRFLHLLHVLFCHACPVSYTQVSVLLNIYMRGATRAGGDEGGRGRKVVCYPEVGVSSTCTTRWL